MGSFRKMQQNIRFADSGTIIKVMVQSGQEVKKRQVLAELVLPDVHRSVRYLDSPEDGVVTSLRCQVGDTVTAGQVFAILSDS